MPSPQPLSFGPNDRRLVLYRVTGGATRIDDYVLVALQSLREHSERVVVIVESMPNGVDRARLERWCDDIILAPEGDDGDRLLGEWADAFEPNDAPFSEIVLTDDSWFGPVAPFGPVLARMDVQPLHAWTMIAASSSEPWLAVRTDGAPGVRWAQRLVAARMAAAAELHAGSVESDDTVVVAAAFPVPSEERNDPLFANPHSLLAAGCPLLSRRAFTQDPALLERHSVVGRRLVHEAERNGYDASVVFQSLARSVAPNQMNAALGLLEIPSAGPGSRQPLRILVVVHVTPDADIDELIARMLLLPDGCDVIATVGSRGDQERVRTLLESAMPHAAERIDVRRVPADADHVSAVFVGCRDALLDGGYDLIVKMRASTAQDVSSNALAIVHRQTWENLFFSREHVSRVLALFDEPGLGVVFSPTPHIGSDVLGAGWRGMRADAERLCAMLGIGVPLGAAPLSPGGGMWIARAHALRLITQHPWRWDDYRGGTGSQDLGQVQECLLSQASGELGMHTRTVMTAANAAISYVPLEYKMDQLTSTMAGFPVDQIKLLRRLGWVGAGGALDTLRMYLRANHAARLARSGPLRRFVADPRDAADRRPRRAEGLELV